jgi:tetratricopeptide (TPR) repeat protein
MTEKEIIATKDKLFYYLSKSQLGRAIELIDELLKQVQDGYYADEVHELKTNYKRMLQYVFYGVSDPEQHLVYQHLLKEAYEIGEHLADKSLQIHSSHYFYRTKRLFAIQPIISDEVSKAGFRRFASLANEKTESDIREYEMLIGYSFDKYWMTSVYDESMLTQVKQLVEDETIGHIELCSLASAITLSSLGFFDEKKCLALVELTKSRYTEVVLRALTGIVLFLYFHQQRISFYPSIRTQITLLFDKEEFVIAAQLIVKQFVRSKETEKITKDITENILPELSKIAPHLRDDLVDMDNEEDIEDKKNIWQDLIEETGIGEKMQQYAELQSQGADIQMSTFSMLKNYSFFAYVSNWFLPFYAEHSSVISLFKAEKENSFLSFLTQSPILCHSDKYSFCLNLNGVPEQYRKAMMNGVKMESEQLKEMESDKMSLSNTAVSEEIINKYIQDLYRFYKLFPKNNKNSFDDIFTYKFDFHKTWMFRFLQPTNDFLTEIANFYFAKDMYENALSAFLQVEEHTEPSADLYRKIGFSFQKMYNYSLAIDYYQKAELIETENVWTIRKIAFCYRNLKQTDKALEYYLMANSLQPDTIHLLFTIGVCYLELKEYDTALNYFYKIEFLQSNHKKAENYIALCSFLQKNYQQAEKYYLKQPEKNSYYELLYLGHTYWCVGNKKEALASYNKSAFMVKKETKQYKNFYESLEQDTDILLKHGITTKDIAFIGDAVRMKLE